MCEVAFGVRSFRLQDQTSTWYQSSRTATSSMRGSRASESYPRRAQCFHGCNPGAHNVADGPGTRRRSGDADTLTKEKIVEDGDVLQRISSEAANANTMF